MKNIVIMPNIERDPDLVYTKKTISALAGKSVFVSEEFASDLRGLATPLPQEKLFDNMDLAIALGGDGTLLSVAHHAAPLSLPILGINLGHLGFLAEIEKQEIEKSLLKLCADEYTIENRIMLRGTITRESGETLTLDALNDIVVSRNEGSRLIVLNLFVGGEYVDEYKADGLLVATPTGSTAYSMSAGGPILDPAVKSFVITPICPHKLYAKTIVAPDDVEIMLTISNNHADPRSAIVSADGRENIILKEGDVLTLRRSAYTAQLVKINGSRFYSVLQHKLLGKDK